MRRLGSASAGVPFIRQDEQPDVAVDGAEWVTDADGAGGDTTSFYVYNALTEAWELERAVGPSEPTAGSPVVGATWRDTGSGTAKQYDGNGFSNIAVTDHANLDNITTNAHQRQLNSPTTMNGSGSVSLSGGESRTVESGNGVVVGGSATKTDGLSGPQFSLQVRNPNTGWADMGGGVVGTSEWRVRANNTRDFDRDADYSYTVRKL